MTVTLLNKDFSDRYLSSTRCALAKALKRTLDPGSELNLAVLVGESSVTVGTKRYRLSVDDNNAIRREYLYPSDVRGNITVELV